MIWILQCQATTGRYQDLLWPTLRYRPIFVPNCYSFTEADHICISVYPNFSFVVGAAKCFMTVKSVSVSRALTAFSVCGVLRVRLVKHKQKYMWKAYRRRKQVSKAALYPPPGGWGVSPGLFYFKTSIRALFYFKVLCLDTVNPIYRKLRISKSETSKISDTEKDFEKSQISMNFPQICQVVTLFRERLHVGLEVRFSY